MPAHGVVVAVTGTVRMGPERRACVGARPLGGAHSVTETVVPIDVVPLSECPLHCVSLAAFGDQIVSSTYV